MDQANKNALMSIPEVAAELRMSKSTIENWLSQGKYFKRVKIGSRTFIRRTEVEGFLEQAVEK